MSALPDKLYYSISELSDHFEVAPSLLRYWESEFNTIKPKRNSKGTRFYTKKDIEEIRKIYHLVKEKGFTLSGARDQLKKSKKKVDGEIEILARLNKVRDRLSEIRKSL
ncbi:MerR family transcriptional regulator [bacterium]|nr:MerR family transcriptional regulator [bacterium]